MLAALRVVSEPTPAPEAARTAGLSVDALQARLMAYAEDGWLVATD